MKKYLLLALVLLSPSVTRLAAQSVTYTFDPNTDFSKFKTYKWVAIKDAPQLDELTADQLIATLDVELAKKGLTKTQSDTADLYIGYQIAKGNASQLGTPNLGVSYGSGVGGSSGSAAVTTTVHSGKLVLDMYESEKKQLVWRGVIAHSIDANAKPDQKQKHMDQTVAKLLKNYPPAKKK